MIGKLGGVQDILSAVRAFPNSSEIAGNCCGALWSLSVNEGNAKIVTEERGLQDVINTFEKHSGKADVIEAACSALWSLSMEGRQFYYNLGLSPSSYRMSKKI